MDENVELINQPKNSDTTNYIANNLATLLKLNHLTVNQLAQHIGLPMMTVRRLISGETEDPRISTLKLLANYFDLTVDHLINHDQRHLVSMKKTKSYLIPKLNWDTLPETLNNHEWISSDFNEWQSISLDDSFHIGQHAFALESRPSMFPRFPKGTVFIIDPSTTPTDGDVILIKIKHSNTYTLRELIIDPPDWHLSPLVSDSHAMSFSKDEHEIAGVCLLSILYHPKMNG